jgi:lipoyl synthase
MTEPVSNKRKPGRLPEWFKVPLGTGERYQAVRKALASQNLHTVCSSAKCPNAGECWSSGTATFMILGDVCTRDCRFCAVEHGVPIAIERSEPERLYRAVKALKLSYVVVTSVTRDDLKDGGASVFADVIRVLKRNIPDIAVEVLIPDFAGSSDALSRVLDANPDILNHNIETVHDLYPAARPQADYRQSLELLKNASAKLGTQRTKSGVMVGLGETRDQLGQLFSDLVGAGVGRLTIGQYLQPASSYLPIARFVPPSEFEELKAEALNAGFIHVNSGPLVRSSYHASEISGRDVLS